MSTPFTLPIGSTAPEFRLPSTTGVTCTLSELKGSVGTVVFFTCNHCPYVLGSDEHTATLAREYADNGINFIAINSNSANTYADDGYEGMVARMHEFKFPWHYLHDESQDVARAYGALRTPHFFLFNKNMELVYTGRSIDQPRDWTKATSFELRDALDDLVAGREVQASQTNPIGCNVKWDGQDAHWMPREACDLVVLKS